MYDTQQQLASVGCTATTQALDWNTDANVIAYGGSHFVVFQRPEQIVDSIVTPARVVQTAAAHTARVNTVQWLRGEPAKPGQPAPITLPELFSGSSDGSVCHWVPNGDPAVHTTNWVCKQTLSDHSTSVCVVSSRLLDNGSTVLLTSGGDEKVVVWHRATPEQEFVKVQTLPFPKHYIMAITLASLETPEGPVLLAAIAGDDMMVHLYARSSSPQCPESPAKFGCVDKLPGHEDWIRGLDFASNDGALLLASGAQDCFIRLWRIEYKPVDEGDSADTLTKMLQTAERNFHVGSLRFCVRLDALLSGHENKVMSLQWSLDRTDPLKLVSSSADKTVVMWQQDMESGVWLDLVRLGEVGGNTLGFFGARMGPKALELIAHGYQGALHHWKCADERWTPVVTTSGHFKGVYGVSWSPDGAFLLSASDDQTARAFSKWTQSSDTKPTWHEIARPQVHGYDLRCVTMITPTLFASGADEKVMRLFEAPQAFLESISTVSSVNTDKWNASKAVGASVPALGLSNKAVFEDGTTQDGEAAVDPALVPGKQTAADSYRSTTSDAVFPFMQSVLSHPPFEESLIQNTLWPEVHKLYGHEFELVSCAATHDGTLLATACKASQLRHAVIRLWDVATGLQVDALPGHELTVVQLAFSPDDKYLISTSRDRSICVFERTQKEDGATTYMHIATKPKAHARIIWALAWSHDGKYFATGARDKSIKIWSFTDDQGLVQVGATPKMEDSVTCIDFAPRFVGSNYLLSVGLDNGKVFGLEANAEEPTTWTLAFACPTEERHCATVRSARFQPAPSSPETALVLATCSLDQVIRIHQIQTAS
eukprot:m.14892 g.14892  ORF g.14892 m.14892 type:complete len:825 (+) comp6451_c0_seq1:234-2708(+)